MSDVPDIEQQRVDARAAYLTGRFADAIEVQRCVVEFADQDPHAALTDHLRLALYLYGAGDHVGQNVAALNQSVNVTVTIDRNGQTSELTIPININPA